MDSQQEDQNTPNLVEDISAPAGFPRITARWELLLGLALALIVLAFAAVDWWPQQSAATDYASATAAVERRDWDAARDLFSRLGDYRDASEQLAAAVVQIRARDSAYSAGMAAVNRADWKDAAASLGVVVTIQPQFRDAGKWYEAARGEILGASFKDVVYRRSRGAPGLYLLQGSPQEILLPSSDSASRVWATDMAGHIIYDIPASAVRTSTSITGGDASIVPQRAAERRMQLATVGGTSLQTILLDTPASGPRLFFLGRGGLWRQTAANSRAVPPGVRGYAPSELQYIDLSTGAVSQLSPRHPDWRVLAVDTSTARLLFGEFTAASPSSILSTHLYLSGPTGGSPELIAEAGGVIRSASFSPDGDYLLYTTIEESSSSRQESLCLVDLRQPYAGTVIIRSATANVEEPVQLAATFRPGKNGMQLLIKHSDELSATFSLRDLASGREARLWNAAPHQPEMYWLQPNGTSIVFREFKGDGAHFTLVSFDPNELKRATTQALPVLPAGRQVFVDDVRVEGSYVLYTARRYSRFDTSGVLEVYAAEIGSDAQPKLLFESPPQPSLDTSLLLPLPGAFLAYTTANGIMRLRSFDSVLDMVALDGVDAVWPFDLLRPVVWTPGD